MACAAPASSATVTITEEEPEVKRQRSDESVDNDAPPLDELLVALDVASRDETGETENTITALVKRARADGAIPRDYLVLAILIAFKRRNHAASQAEGMGAGERRLLRTVLKAIAKHEPNMVSLVLPLVPLYGSWRDMLVLAEELLELEDEGERPEQALLVDAICACFAAQMQKDSESLNDEESLPSSAAKYSPHEGRHSGTGSSAKRKLNKRLADCIAKKLGLGQGADGREADVRRLRAQYRRLRAALNKRLAEQGHLLEPLLSARRLDAIQFTKAPKTALAKARKAIMKDPAAAACWERAMATSSKAVPDITDLLQAAAEAIAEEAEPDENVKLTARRLRKAVAAAREARAKLLHRAEEMVGAAEGAHEADAPGAAAALQETARLPTLPVVLSAAGLRPHMRDDRALLMAAFIVARAQALSHVAVDGALVELSDPPAAPPVTACSSRAAASSAAAAAEAEAPEPSFEAFVARAAAAAAAAAAVPATAASANARLLAGGTAMLGTVEGRTGDVLALCTGFAPAAEPDELSQTTALLKAEGMRALLVHRMREKVEGGTPFAPRRELRPMAARGSEVLDVCFVLDLTGSMGQWIDACKTHIAAIIEALRDELDIGGVRVAFVGYRDWGERNRATPGGRVVVAPFVPIARVHEISTAIAAEEADGGGDGPEDVLIALEAACGLAWQGDMRVCVFIADAPAHGFSGSSELEDDFPGGLCPDQRTPLPTVVRRLADEKGVDMLCTELNASYTKTMFAMFHERGYAGGDGFGVLPMSAGGAAFKSALLGTLSTALLGLIAPSVQTAGVQTFDGTTLSAVTATLTSSLRESIDDAAALLCAPTAEEAAASATEHAEAVEAARVRVAALEVAAAEAAAGGDGGGSDDDEESRAVLRDKLAAAREALAAAGSRPAPPRAARGDAARLRAALEADELRPVRLALGLPLPTEALTVEAAASLLRAGVCVGDMQAKGYPAPFIAAMRTAAATLMRRI